MQTKIFVDCHVFDDGFQGTTTYLKGLYLELISDYTKKFYFACCDVKNVQKIFGKQDNIVYLQYKNENKFYRLLIDIPKLIKANKIDFAHFQYIVAPIKNCKYIVTTHDLLFIDFPEYFPFLNRLKNTFLYKWSARHSDIVLTVSEYSKERIKKHFGIKEVYITNNAVSSEFFELYDKKSIQEEVQQKFKISKYLIFVSRWEPRKKHDLILKGFIELNLFNDYDLLFIGSTTFENKTYIEHYIKLSPTLQKKIHQLDRIDFKDMLMLLRGAELSIYPSVAEGFGIPPLESIAARIPTITSNTTAMSDFDFLDSYSFDPNNYDDFKEKLLKAFKINDLEMNHLITALKNKYSWKKSANVYSELIEKNKRGLT